MKTYNIIISLILFLCVFTLSRCKKQEEWLSKKPVKNTTVPETLTDFQAILDVSEIINKRYSTAGLMGSDNIYLPDAEFNALDQVSQNLYTWKKEIWSGPSSSQWRDYYMLMENANVVLDGLKNINTENGEYKNVMGQALFHRASAMYNLAVLFSKAYNVSTSETDLGIPVRLTSDVNVIAQRASLAATFRQTLADADAASKLLFESQQYVQRPVKAAAFALLARIYLYMGDYENARSNANSSLSLHSELLDYNNTILVDANSDYRFPYLSKGNPEVLFYSESSQFSAVWPEPSSSGLVSPVLYQSYMDNDLRKVLFYAVTETGAQYRGSYTGSYSNFCGIGTNEVYLIRAECYARLGDKDAALADLNTLLRYRFKTGEFAPVTAESSAQALAIILEERNKELAFVGDIRWSDLKRLNLETQFSKTIIRVVDGTTYSLMPKENHYVLPIPDDELNFSGIQQNQR